MLKIRIFYDTPCIRSVTLSSNEWHENNVGNLPSRSCQGGITLQVHVFFYKKLGSGHSTKSYLI